MSLPLHPGSACRMEARSARGADSWAPAARLPTMHGTRKVVEAAPLGRTAATEHHGGRNRVLRARTHRTAQQTHVSFQKVRPAHRGPPAPGPPAQPQIAVAAKRGQCSGAHPRLRPGTWRGCPLLGAKPNHCARVEHFRFVTSEAVVSRPCSWAEPMPKFVASGEKND